MEPGALWSPPVILEAAAQEVGGARQGCAQGEVRDGGSVAMSKVDIALRVNARRHTAQGRPEATWGLHSPLPSTATSTPPWERHLREGQCLLCPPEPPCGKLELGVGSLGGQDEQLLCPQHVLK